MNEKTRFIVTDTRLSHAGTSVVDLRMEVF